MPLTLRTRIGIDTLGKLELAAQRRYAEARRLIQNEPLGAIYLFGYTVEIRLKVAYYRTVGLSASSPLMPYRNIAEAQIRNLGITGAVGHNLYGWAKLLEFARANTPGAAVLPIALASDMYLHVQNVDACWSEVLRYRANRPYDQEVSAVTAGANWFRANSRRLWR